MTEHQPFGETTPSGEKWVGVEHNRSIVRVPLKACSGARPLIFDLLAAQGVIVAGVEPRKRFLTAVSTLSSFPPANLIEHSGWSGGQYALPDGTVIAPADQEAGTAIFPVVPGKCHVAGSLEDWKAIIKLVEKQPLLLFGIMTAFAAVLMRLTSRVSNIGFEIVGPPSAHKSVMQQLAASVYGSPGLGRNRHWWITLSTLFGDMDREIATHADTLMILKGASLFFAGETPARRAGRLKTVLTRLGSPGGSSATTGADQNLIYLSASEAPLSELNGPGDDVGAASNSMLITLRIRSDQAFGVFASVPDDYGSASALPTRSSRR